MTLRGLATPFILFALLPTALRADDAPAVHVPIPGLENVSLEPIDWKKTGETEGIVSFKREIPGSDIIAMRGQGMIDAPVGKVAQVIFDIPRSPEWIDSLTDAHIVRKVSELEYVEYDHVATPFIMKDRDFIIDGIASADIPSKTIFLNMKPVVDPLAPPTSYVRGEIRGGFLMKSIDGGKRTYLVAEMHADPKGSVPKFIVNMFQSGWAEGTLEAIRDQVKKPDVVESERLKTLFKE